MWRGLTSRPIASRNRTSIMRCCTKKLCLSFFVLTLIFLVVALIIKGKRKPIDHSSSRTRNNLKYTGVEVGVFIALDAKSGFKILPMLAMEEAFVVDGREFYQLLCKLHEVNPAAIDYPWILSSWPRESAIVDAWGNPIQLQFERIQNEVRVMMWSNGKNCTNEFGSGDDIVWPLTVQIDTIEK